MPRSKQPAKNTANAKPVVSLIRVIRGRKVIRDTDWAAFYQVETRTLKPGRTPQQGPVPGRFHVQAIACGD
jgi:hypothetical protein